MLRVYALTQRTNRVNLKTVGRAVASSIRLPFDDVLLPFYAIQQSFELQSNRSRVLSNTQGN